MAVCDSPVHRADPWAAFASCPNPVFMAGFLSPLLQSSAHSSPPSVQDLEGGVSILLVCESKGVHLLAKGGMATLGSGNCHFL